MHIAALLSVSVTASESNTAIPDIPTPPGTFHAFLSPSAGHVVRRPFSGE